MEHSFNVDLAKDFSVETSIFLSNLAFWTLKNLANKKHIYYGLCWSYNSLEALGHIFPYWSKKQLERIIANAVKEGLLLKGNYNQTKYDRTTWYALTPKAYAYFPHLLDENLLKTAQLSISPFGEMDFRKKGNGFPQKGKPIPDSKPDKKLNNIYTRAEDDCLSKKETECNHEIKNKEKTGESNNQEMNYPIQLQEKNESEQFKKFWNIYPVRKQQKKAMVAWQSQNCDVIADEIIEKLKQQIMNDSDFKSGYVPNPFNYITQERWNDEIKQSNLKNTRNANNNKSLVDDDSWASSNFLDKFI